MEYNLKEHSTTYTSLQRPTALPSMAASAIFSPIKMMDS